MRKQPYPTSIFHCTSVQILVIVGVGPRVNIYLLIGTLEFDRASWLVPLVVELYLVAVLVVSSSCRHLHLTPTCVATGIATAYVVGDVLVVVAQWGSYARGNVRLGRAQCASSVR